MAGTKADYQIVSDNNYTNNAVKSMSRSFRGLRGRSVPQHSGGNRKSSFPRSLSTARSDAESISNYSVLDMKLTKRTTTDPQNDMVPIAKSSFSTKQENLPLTDLHQENRLMKVEFDPVQKVREAKTKTSDSSAGAISQRQIQTTLPMGTTGIAGKTELENGTPSSTKHTVQTKVKSPKKGAKGAMNWLRKAVAKDSQVTNPETVAPASIGSRRSYKSFEAEPRSFDGTHDASLFGGESISHSRKGRRPVSRRREYADTSEAQQRRWLLQVHRSIRDSAVREVIVRSAQQVQPQQQKANEISNSSLRPNKNDRKQQQNTRHVDFVSDIRNGQVNEHQHSNISSSQSEIFEEPTMNEEDDDENGKEEDGDDDEYYNPHPHKRQYSTNVVAAEGRQKQKRDFSAYSTFDDEASISSIELLFNWLTCRETVIEDRRTGKRQEFNPQGMEFELLHASSSDPYNPNRKPYSGMCR